MLAAWGISERGEKLLLGLCPGTKEDTASARGFLRDLKARNLNEPLLVVSDGAPGLIRALEEVFPKSLRQRCLAHRMRSLEGRCRPSAGAKSKPRRRPPIPPPRRCWHGWRKKSSLNASSASCRAIRTTNLLERLFGEERRRTKVIPHAFGERAVLKLIYAALIRASQTWRRIVISEFELKQIDETMKRTRPRVQGTNGVNSAKCVPSENLQQEP